MDLLKLIKTSPVVCLSPMDGITDQPFRLLVNQTSKPDITFTEFVSAEGLSHGAIKLFDHLLYSDIERPIVGQLFGKDPESFYKAAVILSHLGFDGIDINMGCPAKTVTQHGSGAALISKPALAAEIIKSTRQGINDYFDQKIKITDIGLKEKSLNIVTSLARTNNKPTLSIKTRIGVDKNIVSQWITFLLEQSPDFISLHGRTLSQGYAGVADWEAISEANIIAKKFNIPLLGNGDITSHQMGLDYCQKYDVAGVLIGRAVLGNPWVFGDKMATFAEKYAVAKTQYQLFTKIFPTRRTDCLRHHLLAYASGHPRAKELRAKLVAVSTFDDLCSLEADFLNC